MTKKQIMQVSIASLAVILIIFWLCYPGWNAGKILGIISMALLCTSMALSYLEEERRKKKQ